MFITSKIISSRKKTLFEIKIFFIPDVFYSKIYFESDLIISFENLCLSDVGSKNLTRVRHLDRPGARAGAKNFLPNPTVAPCLDPIGQFFQLLTF